jgi:outer membrane protein assembly factor BamB
LTCTVAAASVADPDFTASVTVVVIAPAAGELLWVRELGSPTSDEYGLHVSVDTSGNSVVAGTTDGPWLATLGGDQDAFAVELDATSTSAWLQQFGSEGTDSPQAITFTDSGSRIIAGTTGTALFVRSVDPLGARLFYRTFGNPTLATAVRAMAFTTDGDILVAGSYDTGLGVLDPGGEAAWVARFDQEGVFKWLSRFGAGESLYTYVSDIHVDRFDNIYLTGEQEKAQGYLTRFDAAGNQQWWESLTFDFATYGATAANIATDTNGRVFMVGAWEPPSVYAARRGYLVAYDPDGTRLWTTVIGPAEGTDVTAVAVDDGHPIVAGSTSGVFGEATGARGQQAAFVAKYDPSGVLVWVRSPTTGLGDARSSDLAIGPNGTTTLVCNVDGQVLVARYSR